jgi:hypothetical protein
VVVYNVGGVVANTVIASKVPAYCITLSPINVVVEGNVTPVRITLEKLSSCIPIA